MATPEWFIKRAEWLKGLGSISALEKEEYMGSRRPQPTDLRILFKLQRGQGSEDIWKEFSEETRQKAAAANKDSFVTFGQETGTHNPQTFSQASRTIAERGVSEVVDHEVEDPMRFRYTLGVTPEEMLRFNHVNPEGQRRIIEAAQGEPRRENEGDEWWRKVEDYLKLFVNHYQFSYNNIKASGEILERAKKAWSHAELAQTLEREGAEIKGIAPELFESTLAVLEDPEKLGACLEKDTPFEHLVEPAGVEETNQKTRQQSQWFYALKRSYEEKKQTRKLAELFNLQAAHRNTPEMFERELKRRWETEQALERARTNPFARRELESDIGTPSPADNAATAEADTRTLYDRLIKDAGLTEYDAKQVVAKMRAVENERGRIALRAHFANVMRLVYECKVDLDRVQPEVGGLHMTHPTNWANSREVRGRALPVVARFFKENAVNWG